ncbi:hypothetical protein OE749_03605 [Aestuariibacter sp. AA17]|uniref:EF-hand domain-containing protein n=1 Tax=Fluctibacter corallii TaxID=2984329 RepID=A0ABT3A514_9ALTE|nr:hypothetical protein [Aestuariibacter sp. AA17]MCV2883788.1 hypothetical protein [Aestuariibacter sp. AA17]
MIKAKHVLIATVTACSFLAAAQLHAQEAPQNGKRGHKHGKPSVEKMLARLDIDQSGTLTLDEMLTGASDKAARKFERKDANADGSLTFEEASSGRERPDLSDIAEDIAACVADIKDETGDENIVVPDFSSRLTAEERFDTIDANDDNLIDLSEATSHAESRATDKFNALDTDLNGEVSEDELTAHADSRRATRQAVRNCVDSLSDDSGI